MKSATDAPPDVLERFEQFKKTQLGRLLACDPPTGKRVRDLPPDGQRRALMGALVARKRTAPPDDWCHKLDPERVDW